MARGRRPDLTGQVFGNLTVLDHRSGRWDGVYWLCRCSCGAKVFKRADNLLGGRAASCSNAHRIRDRWGNVG